VTASAPLTLAGGRLWGTVSGHKLVGLLPMIHGVQSLVIQAPMLPPLVVEIEILADL
jgi:hypothetical protein